MWWVWLPIMKWTEMLNNMECTFLLQGTIIKKHCQSPKAHRNHSIEYFDSFNIFRSKPKLQQALKSWLKTSAWFCLANDEIHIEQLWQIHVKTQIPVTNLKDPCSNLEKSIYQLEQIRVSTIQSSLTTSIDLQSDWLTRQGNDWTWVQ